DDLSELQKRISGLQQHLIVNAVPVIAVSIVYYVVIAALISMRLQTCVVIPAIFVSLPVLFINRNAYESVIRQISVQLVFFKIIRLLIACGERKNARGNDEQQYK